MSKKLLKTNEKISRKDASEKIRSIADKIADGRVELSSDNDSVTLEPSSQVEFELQVEEEKDGDLSIEIEVEWSEEESGGVEIQ